MRILIADDDAAWVHLLSSYFGAAGHEVLSAGTFGAALALAARKIPDVMLLDSSLPDGEAREFCPALRADRRFYGTALVLVSGTVPEEGCGGADLCLLKGEPLTELGAAVARVLAARKEPEGRQ